MTDEAAGKGTGVDPAYYSDGVRWEQSVYRTTALSRNAWRAMSLVLGLALIVAIGALWGLTPLKSTEVVTLLVDKTTGFVEVARPLEAGGKIPQQEAVTRANIVRFIRARETYDPRGLKDNFDLASLLSGGMASRELQLLYSASNPANPMKVYGPEGRVSVLVKSVSFLNENTASVRFDTEQKTERDVEPRTTAWVATVRYRYTATPMRNDWRFDNPQGFQVMEYRRDQETVGPAEAKQ
ncbi:type IV secretion system protein VirB8 [Rhizobiales bacterium GAS113]|nr:type IV secretion system protein VirB8 [Rhizobiales bacterium GAS113]